RPGSIVECQDRAEALIVKNPQAKEPHWDESAELWAAAMLVLLALQPHGPYRSLQGLRKLLTDQEKMKKGIDALCATDAWGGSAARFGHQLRHYQDKELASTLTTTNRHLRFLDTPEVVASTS